MGQDVLSCLSLGLGPPPKGGPPFCHLVFCSRDGEVWNFKLVARICRIKSAMHVRPE
jgi:hypothetical protein